MDRQAQNLQGLREVVWVELEAGGLRKLGIA
jgi:hypothetical protein